MWGLFCLMRQKLNQPYLIYILNEKCTISIELHFVFQKGTWYYPKQGRTQVGVGVKTPPLSLIFYKTLFPRKGDEVFSHTFCLLICRLIANMTE